MDSVISTPSEYPQRKRWSRAEYERFVAMGAFLPEDRLELIDGDLIQQMPQNTPHTTSLRLTDRAMNRIFGDGYDVRTQMPLICGESMPEPDIAVVIGNPRDYRLAHPETAVLIVEISDTTLGYDRSTKGSLYARAGVIDYWIVNIADRLLEVHRDPAPMAEQMFGWHYRSILPYTEDQSIAPLAAPDLLISIADLLP
jgi:Uma2 family endonuclease